MQKVHKKALLVHMDTYLLDMIKTKISALPE